MQIRTFINTIKKMEFMVRIVLFNIKLNTIENTVLWIFHIYFYV